MEKKKCRMRKASENSLNFGREARAASGERCGLVGDWRVESPQTDSSRCFFEFQRVGKRVKNHNQAWGT